MKALREHSTAPWSGSKFTDGKAAIDHALTAYRYRGEIQAGRASLVIANAVSKKCKAALFKFIERKPV